MPPQSSKRSSRIAVRVDDDALRQLDEMVAATGASVDEIVRASLSAEYARYKSASAFSKRSAIFANAGTYRSGEASARLLSSNYKKLFADMQVGTAATRTNSRD
jgi:predicted transcriptional regulator